MSTDNLLLLNQIQQIWPGSAAGTASGTSTDAAGGDPAAFLQALLQHMQAAVTPPSAAIEAGNGVSEGSGSQTAGRTPAPISVEALVDRLKAVVASWKDGPVMAGDPAGAAVADQEKAPGGKSLPEADDDTHPSGLPLASGAEQWLQDLMQRLVPSAVPAAVPQEALASVEAHSESLGAAPTAASAHRAVGELVQMLRAAGLPMGEALASQLDAVEPDAVEKVPADPDVRPTTPGFTDAAAASLRPQTPALAVPVENPASAVVRAVPERAVSAADAEMPDVQQQRDKALPADAYVLASSGKTPGRSPVSPAAEPRAADPVALSASGTVSKAAADQPQGGLGMADGDAAAAIDPVIVRLLQRAPEAPELKGDASGAEPVAEVVRDALVPPAVVIAKTGVPPRSSPKPAESDARNLSGLERLVKRSASDADPLGQAVAQAPAAVREQAVAMESEESELAPVPVKDGVAAAVAVATAESKPVEVATTKAQTELRTPVQHPGWSEELGERVNWLAGLKNGIQTAEIRLNPAHLGPLEVRVDLNRDQASIQFVSHHAAVREAIESAVPKLREMLGEQNLSLVDVNVSQQSLGGDQQRQPATAQFDFGRNPQGGGAAAPQGSFAQAPEPATSGDAAPHGRSDGSSLSLYA